MRVSLEVKELLDSLLVLRLVTIRADVPLLSHAVVRVNEDRLVSIEATDRWISVRKVFEDRASEPCLFTIPVAQVISLLKGRYGKDRVELSEGRLTIGGVDFPLESLDVSAYPEMDFVGGDKAVYMKIGWLDRFRDMMYAMSKDVSRFNLDSLCLDNGVVIATDGSRLERKIFPVISSDRKIVIPRKAVAILGSKVFTKAEYTMWSLKDSGNRLVVSSRSWTISTGVLEEYPDYKRVLMDDAHETHVVTMNRKALLEGVKQFKGLLTKDDRAIGLSFGNGNGDCVTISRGDMTRFSLPLEVVSVRNGEGCNLLLNHDFLVELLSASKDTLIEMRYYKEGSPLRFRGTNQDSLLMPMRK